MLDNNEQALAEINRRLEAEIAERERLEKALAASEQKNRDLFDTAVVGLYRTRVKDGKALAANRACVEILGYDSVDQLLVEFVAEKHYADPERRKQLMEQLALRGRVDGFEIAGLRRDGSPVQLALSAALYSDKGYLEGVVVDITEQKRAERELKERQMYLEAVLAAAPDAIVTLNPNQRIVEWNPGAERLFGYSRQEAIGKQVDHLITTPEVFDEAVEITQMVASERAVGPVETVRYRKDGTPVEVILSGSPIFVRDDLIGAVGVYTDITERVRAQEERHRLVERVRRQQAILVQLATHPDLAQGRLDSALRAVTAAAAETFEVDRVNIWRLSPDGRELYCVSAFEPMSKEFVIGRVIMIEQFPRFFAALESGRVVAVSDVRSDPRTLQLTADFWDPSKINSSLSAPVRLHGQVVGLVCCDQVGESRTWTSDEIAFVGQIADLVAQAFLSADLRRRSEELAAITRVSREITSVRDLSKVFNSIARSATELSHSDASGVFAFRSDGRLYVEVGFGVKDAFIEAVNAQGIPLGRGAIGRASVTHRPVQIPDALADASYSYGDLVEMEHIRSILAVPMLHNEDLIGGIVLWHRQPRRFAPEVVALLEALAQQCVNAVENARLFEAEARRRREAEVLQQASLALGSTLDVDLILEQLMDQVSRVIPYDGANVTLIDGDVARVTKQRGYGGPGKDGEGIFLSLSVDQTPTLHRMLDSRLPYVIRDTRADPRWVQIESRQWIRSWVGAPLVVRNRVIGFFSLDSRTANLYSPEHAELLATFATHAAIAIENARLFTEEEQRTIALTNSLKKQRELDGLKDEFIQNVSHELRTPLGLIRGYAELLDFGMLGDLQSDQQEPVAIIARRARILGKMVEDLTAIFTSETGKSKREMVDMADLVRKLKADFRVAAAQAGLTLVVQVPPIVPLILGDATQLYRVLDNLVGNAIKFTPSGGRIDVRLWREGERLVLEVADTGVGIPEEQLQRVFERFYQVDGSMSRRYGGAGLGLSLVKEIIEAHGGSVNVESLVGQGSTFKISLPAGVEIGVAS